MTDVASINLDAGEAVLDDGRTVPITNMFDIQGHDTLDPDEAVAFVCGAGGEWFCGHVDDFEEVTLH